MSPLCCPQNSQRSGLGMEGEDLVDTFSLRRGQGRRHALRLAGEGVDRRKHASIDADSAASKRNCSRPAAIKPFSRLRERKVEKLGKAGVKKVELTLLKDAKKETGAQLTR